MNPIQRFLQDNSLREPEYIGDGVYCANDGWQLWLLVEREGRVESVALDPGVHQEVVRYWAKLFPSPEGAER